MGKSLRSRATRQAIGLAFVGAVTITGAYAFAQRAEGPTGLKADVSVLRSQAAETLLLVEEAPGLPPTFTQAHAEQLGRDIQDQEQHIARLQVVSELSSAHDSARHAAEQLRTIVVALAQGEPATTEAGAAAGLLARRLETIEESLRR